jgi:hypothetical protein
MTNDRTILITGVTGQQGGAVALQRTGFRLRGLTRKPDSERAAALARQGVDAQTPIEKFRHYSKEMALMLEWFERVGYSADIAGLEREFGRSLTKLPDWAAHHARSNGR